MTDLIARVTKIIEDWEDQAGERDPRDPMKSRIYREAADLRAALTRLEDAEAAVAALTEALEACVASLERANTAEGVCGCGDSMDRHPNPMNCGHSPVDIGDYYAGQALEAARAALSHNGRGE